MTFINDLDDMTQHTLSKLAHDSKQGGRGETDQMVAMKMIKGLEHGTYKGRLCEPGFRSFKKRIGGVGKGSYQCV